MGLTRTTLKRPVTTLIVVLCLIVFGVTSVTTNKLELMSEINMPMLIISAVYPGASPEDVEELVIKEIEDEVGTLSGVETITSTSSENFGMVLLSYEYGTNIDDAYDDLKKKVDALAAELPDAVDTPTIIEMDINDITSYTVAINNDSVSNLYNYVTNTVVPQIEKLGSVANVSVSGGQAEYVRVELIPEKLAQYRMNMSSVATAIASANFSMPLGNTIVGNRDLAVTSGVDFDTVELLKQIPITLGNGNIIYIEDIANIYLALEDPDSIGRYNGSDTISIGVNKNQDSTDIEVSNDVSKVLNEMQEEDPNLQVTVINDNSQLIRNALKTVFETMVLAVAVAMTIIFIFLGDLKASLIVGTSIPISILSTLIAVKVAGFSLNIITLGSMVVGIGMMVDNSIVVLESCFRTSDDRSMNNFHKIALEGTKTVFQSILGGTATTCVVFLPLSVMQGLSGQLFKPLGFSIVFGLVASLISAITLVPLCYAFYRPKEKKTNPSSRFMGSLQDGYRALVSRLLNHKAAVMITSVALLALSLFLATQIDMELMPMTDDGIIAISADTQPGLTIDKIDEIGSRIEAYVAQDPDVESYQLSYGSSGLSLMGGSGITVTAYLKDDRNRETSEVLEEWEDEMLTWTDCVISLEEQSSMGSMSMLAADEIEIILLSTDYDELKDISDDIVDKLRAREDTAQIHSTMENDAPLVNVAVDPVKATAEGLAPAQVAGQVYMMLSGNEAMTLNVNGNDLSVMIEYAADEYDTIDELQGIVVYNTMGQSVALSDIAEIGFKDSPASIAKTDKQYQVTISGSLNDLADENSLDEIHEEIVKPHLSVDVKEQDNTMTEMMNEEFGSLYTAIGFATFLVFVVMAAQFESPKFAIMVMTTIPFALIGSFGLLWLTGIKISMPALLGFMILVGTVVNNGILYVDTVNQYRAEMDLNTALVEAGATRLRPILMTTLTTVVALVPLGLGIGQSGQMMQALALVDMGGLIASTVLALLMLPIYYSVMSGKKPVKNMDLELE
ncbi:MAG: efflux RND transporter permease subunit [Lachnospiraceae bacterium]|nr:efflux RND transporter permease subunit [Lachnospiraceae bacterium]